MTRPSPSDHGSAVLETVLVVPVLVVLICFVVFVGRLTAARNDITAAAKDGARAASLQRDPYSADAAARDTITASLKRTHTDCAAVTVTVDTANFAPGGYVRVDIACTVSLAQITQLAVPGDKTISDHATEVIDQYRGAP